MKKLLAFLIITVLMFSCVSTVFARYNPYDSFVQVIGIPGQQSFGYAQDMYTPDGVAGEFYVRPEHICIFDNKLYVADSNLKAVYVTDLNGELLNIIGEDILTEPTGVYADRKFIYVADYGSESVFKFSHSGELVNTYTRPTNPLFGRNERFKPMKVVADNAENIYVISEGGTNGVIQINEAGEFLGFFGVNTANVTLQMVLQRLIFTNEQRGQLLSVKPPSPDNIAVDSNGLIYTLTRSDNQERIKKLNIAGKNVLGPTFSFQDTIDIAVDMDGNIFFLFSTGFGFYDSFGRLINANLTEDNSREILGLFRQASSIAVDNEQNIYISDMEKGKIIRLVPTEIAELVFSGIHYYKKGFYVESMDIWNEVLTLNTNFALAHNAMAKAYYKLGDYEQSLRSYMLSDDKAGFSNAFWQVRNDWLQANLGYIMIGFASLFVVLKILSMLDKKYKIYNFLRQFKSWFGKTRLHQEALPLFTVLRHPVDTCDYIKRLKKVSYAGFTLFFVVFMIVQVLGNYFKGYSFTVNYRTNIDIFAIVIMLVVPLFLFVISNYLVSTITDGEGSFKGVLIGTTISFSPVILFALPISILTNYLTVNEAFIYDFSMFVLYGWSLINLFVVIMNIHDYTFLGTIKNLLITVVGMIILLIVAMISYVLFDQFLKFIINFR